jgi:hypothetical protein
MLHAANILYYRFWQCLMTVAQIKQKVEAYTKTVLAPRITLFLYTNSPSMCSLEVVLYEQDRQCTHKHNIEVCMH